ncbi:uncharacterized protein LOC144094140 [Amblyomma americanum]
MSPLSRFGAVLVCARSGYIAEHNKRRQRLQSSPSFCRCLSTAVRGGRTFFTLQAAVAARVYCLLRTLFEHSDVIHTSSPDFAYKRDARAFHQQWTRQPRRDNVNLCATICAGIVATQLKSSCYQENSTYSTLSSYDARGLHLGYSANFVYQ